MGAFASEIGKMSGARRSCLIRFFQSSRNWHRRAWSQHWQLGSGGVFMGNGASSRSAVHLMIPHSAAVTWCEFSPSPYSTYTKVSISSARILLFWRMYDFVETPGDTPKQNRYHYLEWKIASHLPADKLSGYHPLGISSPFLEASHSLLSPVLYRDLQLLFHGITGSLGDKAKVHVVPLE